MTCPEPGSMVEERIDRVLTQYRESWRLLGTLRTYLGQVEYAGIRICAIPDHFDLDTAVGDQLTVIGKWLGWPRCHCVCELPAVFGFCDPKNGGSYDGPYQITGFCEGGTWFDCREIGNGDICIDDDDLYRAFLKARRYQAFGLYDIQSLQSAAQHIWGPTASVVDSGGGRVVLAPGRALTSDETVLLPLVFRVLPIAPGIRAEFQDGGDPVFGFGEGWAGLCDGAWLCPEPSYAYSCP